MNKTFTNKSKAMHAILDLISLIESESSYQAKILQIDNGGKYESNKFISDLDKYEIVLNKTGPDHYEPNPVTE
jgi:hypothetical protein